MRSVLLQSLHVADVTVHFLDVDDSISRKFELDRPIDIVCTLRGLKPVVHEIAHRWHKYDTALWSSHSDRESDPTRSRVLEWTEEVGMHIGLQTGCMNPPTRPR